MQKRNCKSLEVQAEMKCGSGTSHLWKSWQNKCGKRNFRSLPVKKERKEVQEQNFTYLAVKAERKCGSGTSHFWQSMQNESADVELQTFGSQGRAEIGSGTSGLRQLRQSRSVEFQIFSRQDIAEVQSSTLTVQSSCTCGSRS